MCHIHSSDSGALETGWKVQTWPLLAQKGKKKWAKPDCQNSCMSLLTKETLETAKKASQENSWNVLGHLLPAGQRDLRGERRRKAPLDQTGDGDVVDPGDAMRMIRRNQDLRLFQGLDLLHGRRRPIDEVDERDLDELVDQGRRPNSSRRVNRDRRQRARRALTAVQAAGHAAVHAELVRTEICGWEKG